MDIYTKILLFCIVLGSILSIYISMKDIYQQNDDYVEQGKLQNHHYEKSEKKLNVAIIGDYGFGNNVQKQVAYHLNDIAEEENIDFIVGVGDNFYKDREDPIAKPSGVKGLQDQSWDTKWAKIYQNQSYLKNLKWFGTIGNHDFDGTGLLSEFEYNKYGWVIDDFFWTHTASIKNTSVAFIHVDTNFLAYGIEGSDSQPLMGQWFKKLGWQSQEQMLGLIEQQLELYNDYDWKILIAHHPVGYSCKKRQQTDLLLPLIEKYKVDAYLSGHKHQLSYGQNENTAFLLSGAAGDFTKNACEKKNQPIWSKGDIYGFLTFQLSEKKMKIFAHYTKVDKVNWETDQKSEENQVWKQKQLPTFEKKY